MIFALLTFDHGPATSSPRRGCLARYDHGVQRSQVSPNSPATRAGIHANDVLISINGARVTRATEVARRLDRAGLWTQVRYKLSRNGEEFETPLVTAPRKSRSPRKTICASWACCSCSSVSSSSSGAERASCRALLCLLPGSFICWSFHYSGKLDTLTGSVLGGDCGALLAPALLLHFRIGFFPGDRTAIRSFFETRGCVPLAGSL